MSAKKQLAEALDHVPLFAHCTANERRTVARHAQVVDIDAGVDQIGRAHV